MDYESRLRISYYDFVSDLNASHGISLVKHNETGKLYVRKILTVYNPEIYSVLKHEQIEGIPQIIDFYEDNNKLTIIEEYIEGKSLDSIIRDSDSINRDILLDYVMQLAIILDRLHNLKTPIIHRDIKPSNVIISTDGQVYLIDYNASKFYISDKTNNQDTTLLGTHGFAAPEQYGFGKSSAKTDIYGLGILIKELSSKSDTKKPDNDIKTIINKCTMINPNDRYYSVKDLIRDLKRIMPNSKIKRIFNKYAFPGFRSNKLLNKIIAIIGYLFIAFIVRCMGVDTDDPRIVIVYKIIFGLMLLMTVFCTFDYLGIKRILPISKSSNIFLKIIGTILLNSLIYAFLFTALIVIIQFI